LRKAQKQRLGVFERKVLRKIFGPDFNSQTNEWRKLHNYELQMWFKRPDTVKERSQKENSCGRPCLTKAGISS